ncbi:MAG: lactonase family protein [Oscillospiraceae bacterium]|nr:lactonase family protein [Oscillospiraceae bacterium]
MQQTLYIGTYTNDGGKGVYRAALSDGGKLSLIDATESTSPSYLIFSDDRKIIYAANEGREVEGVPGGAVSAFNVQGDGSLKKAAVSSTKGGSPCHVLAHGGYLYGANYGDGTVAVFPLGGDGMPGELEFTHRHEGSGPNERRQEGPHAHCAMTVPGTDVFCVVDLGIDQARFYRKDGKSLALVQALSFDAGAGPRHVVFSKDGRFGWVVTELSNYIYCIEYKSEWVINSKLSTLPPDFSGRSACAAIRLSPDGKLIAASNRFHDSVAVFGVDGADGSLSLKGIYPCGGATPRDIEFSPDGKWLLAANQDSDSVDVLSVAGGFGVVEGGRLAVSRPTSILF